MVNDIQDRILYLGSIDYKYCEGKVKRPLYKTVKQRLKLAIRNGANVLDPVVSGPSRHILGVLEGLLHSS